MLPLIPTTIVGSLPKPSWLAPDWYSIAGNWRLSGDALREAQDDATRLAVTAQIEAGIDIVCDGEQRRPAHHSYFLTQLEGIDFATMKAKTVRGGKLTQDVPRVTGPLALRSHETLEDYGFLRSLTTAPAKMTLPGPSTLVDGTLDEYYGDERTLALAYADVLNAEMRALVEAGCSMIQLDEPAVTRLPEKLQAWGVEALDRAFAGIKAVTCVHVCYGYAQRARSGKQWKHGYDEILPALAKANVEQVSLEFAEPALSPSILELLPGKIIQYGVIDVGRNDIESARQVADRLRAAVEILSPARLTAAPDCGCTALPRSVARAKLHALVAGARMVRAELEAKR
jgi:5-methyltetrahydropteroyltriglutamate--homocysteine methyltransferase